MMDRPPLTRAERRAIARAIRRGERKPGDPGGSSPSCLWCVAEGSAHPAVYEGRRPEGVRGLDPSPRATPGNAVTFSCERHAEDYRRTGWVLRPLGGFPT